MGVNNNQLLLFISVSGVEINSTAEDTLKARQCNLTVTAPPGQAQSSLPQKTQLYIASPLGI